ncbi:MAG: winged helix-turn-helix transcriptional regulator [Bdellovibrionota bacterium]
MKGKTKRKILDFLRQNLKARPHDLTNQIGISPQALHRHLKQLQEQNQIEKFGKPPHVFYKLLGIKSEVLNINISVEAKELLADKYLYATPTGEFKTGQAGFADWASRTNQNTNLSLLAEEYLAVRKKADKFFIKNKSWIDASERFKSIFDSLALKKIFYLDFYSLPKFGKTRLGTLVLHGKQAQSKKIISNLGFEASKTINQIIKENKIDAYGLIPHSLPRELQFLKEFNKNLEINLPQVILRKAYPGEVPVAQKSLSKLSERIENAKSSIFVESVKVPYKKILLIDDAIGSGATLNETAKKLLTHEAVKEVYGFALVGSYKGFEVIKEV